MPRYYIEILEKQIYSIEAKNIEEAIDICHEQSLPGLICDIEVVQTLAKLEEE